MNIENEMNRLHVELDRVSTEMRTLMLTQCHHKVGDLVEHRGKKVKITAIRAEIGNSVDSYAVSLGVVSKLPSGKWGNAKRIAVWNWSPEHDDDEEEVA